MKYTVWIEIEEQVGAQHRRVPGILPDPLGGFTTLKAAKARVWSIVQQHCPDPEHSDCKPKNAKEGK